jgi:predicted nucleic acid-binding protein
VSSSLRKKLICEAQGSKLQVVLDTNILLANLRGARPSNDLKLVLADARAGRFSLIVPELVLEETVNKRREAALDAERKLRQAHSDLAAVGATLELPNVDLTAVVEQFRKQLVELLSSSKTDVPKLPDVRHETIVRRALERRKPFSASGAGYRDALIWETVLTLIGEDDDEIILVTNNSKDFAEDKTGTSLAADLVRDLEARNAIGRVRLIPTLKAFEEEFVAAETIAADDLDKRLNTDSPIRDQLFNALRSQLRAHIFDRENISDRRGETEDLDLPYGTIEATILRATVSNVEQLHGVWVVSAGASEDDVLLELEAEVDAEIELEVELEVEGEPFDAREPWHRERIYRTEEFFSGQHAAGRSGSHLSARRRHS